MNPNDAARLMERVPFGAPNECWLWSATKLSSDGYGQVSISGRTRPAHRAVYELLRGTIPGNLQLDHLCRSRHCVNPAHLEPVTIQENLRRRRWHAEDRYVTPEAAPRSPKTQCVNGHPFTEANVRVRTDRPGPACRTCRCEAQRRYLARQSGSS